MSRFQICPVCGNQFEGIRCPNCGYSTVSEKDSSVDENNASFIEFDDAQDTNTDKKKEKIPKEKKKKEKAPKEKKKKEKPPKEKKEKSPKEKKKKEKPPKEKKKKDKPPKEMKEKPPKEKKQGGFTVSVKLIPPEEKKLRVHVQELKEIFLPLLLFFVAAAWLLLILDIINVISNVINAGVQIGTEWGLASGGRKAFLILKLLWNITGLLIGIWIFYQIAHWKIRKAGKEGEWKFIFKRITKHNIPELLVYSFILMIMNVGYNWSAILMFISTVLIYVMYKDPEEMEIDTQKIWEDLTIWMKGFTILGIALLIWSIILRFVAWVGAIFDQTTDNLAGVDVGYIVGEIIFLVIMALILYYYAIPFVYQHIVNGKYENILNSVLNIGGYRIPIVFFFIGYTYSFSDFGLTYGFQYSNWGFILITSAILILYIFYPGEIVWYSGEKAEKPKKIKLGKKEKAEKPEKEKKVKEKKLKKKKDKGVGKEAIGGESPEIPGATEEVPVSEQPVSEEIGVEKSTAEPTSIPEEKEEQPAEKVAEEGTAAAEMEADRTEEVSEAEEAAAGSAEEPPEESAEESTEESPVEDAGEPEGADESAAPPDDEEVLDEPEEEDYDSFDKVKDRLLALFDGGNYFSSKGAFVSAIKENVDLPEGLTPEEAINILKEKGLVYYSRSGTRGWFRKD